MRFLIPLAMILALAMPVGAEHCTTYSTSEPTLTCWNAPAPTETTGYYVDEDCCVIGCLFSIWVYQESNGIPGLQRGDEVVDDTCHRMIQPDTIVY